MLVKWGVSKDDDVNGAEESMEHMKNVTPVTKNKRLKEKRRSTVETMRAQMFNFLLAEKMGAELRCASNLAESIAWCGGDATKTAFSKSYVLVGTPLLKGRYDHFIERFQSRLYPYRVPAVAHTRFKNI